MGLDRGGELGVVEEFVEGPGAGVLGELVVAGDVLSLAPVLAAPPLAPALDEPDWLARCGE